MDLSAILLEDCVQTGVQPANKQSVLKLIAQLAKKSPLLADIPEETIFAALNEREKLGSTGFGNGIAVPHCALDDVADFVVGILTVLDGVDFRSLDGKDTRLFVFIIGPSSERNRHISILATVSRVLHVPGLFDELMSETNPLAVRESFLRNSRDEISSAETPECCLFHVFVQAESKFYDIIQIFSAMESASVSVTDAKDVGAFLQKLPLFTSLWREEPADFNRIITAVVKKSLTNDTIRQINDIAGGLEKTKGIMVAVQELFYISGSLNS